jgi:hypothetical protein
MTKYAIHKIGANKAINFDPFGLNLDTEVKEKVEE